MRLTRDMVAVVAVGSRIVKYSDFETAYIVRNKNEGEEGHGSHIVELIYGRNIVPVGHGSYEECKKILDDTAIYNPPYIQEFNDENNQEG